MAVLKRLTGDKTVTVAGKSRSFTNYGTTTTVTHPSDLTFSVLAGRTAVFGDPANPDSVEIVTPPERGRLVARADGRFSFDLQDELDTTNITFVYNRVIGGVTTEVAATIHVAENLYKEAGWTRGKFYLLETDGDDKIIVEPGETSRAIYCSNADGLTAADIVAREPGLTSEGQVTGAWLRDNPANGEGGLYYGETEALALDHDRGGTLFRYLKDIAGTSPHIYFKRGETYANRICWTAALGAKGESPLHPVTVSTYGAGDRPVFTTEASETLGSNTYNLLIQEYDSDATQACNPVANILYDGIKLTGAYFTSSGGGSQMSDRVTMRRVVSLDSIPDAPKDANFWAAGQADRYEGFYYANTDNLLIDKFFISGAGWDYRNGYRPDRSSLAGKSPDKFSHGIYGSFGSQGVIISNGYTMNNSANAIQTRSGGFHDNIFAAGSNSGLSPIGNGHIDVGGRGAPVCFGMVHRYVQTQAGLHDIDWDNGVDDPISQVPYAGGISNHHGELSIFDSIVINRGEKSPWSDPTEVTLGAPDPDRTAHGGNQNFAYENGNKGGAVTSGNSRYELVISNWKRDINPDDNVGAVPQATRDALTIGAYLDNKLSTTGSTLRDFDDYARTLDAPWELLDEVNDYFLGPFGKGRPTPRVAAQTVRFAPDPVGDTPGCLSHFTPDWNTKDLPGTVAGDSIDLDGHWPNWNYTPANAIADFTFGVGGGLTMWGSALKPTGEVVVDAGGNTLRLRQGAKFHLPAHSSANLLTVEAIDSRFLTAATVTGAIDLTAYGMTEVIVYEGGALTVPSGRTWTLGGMSKPGFDGDGGGAASLTIAGTVAFKRATTFEVIGLTQYDALVGSMRKTKGIPRVGEIVEGETSGATAVVSAVYMTGGSKAKFILDVLSGEFQASEPILGPTWGGGFWIGDSRTQPYGVDQDLQAIGTIDGTPTYSVATIREVRTGINGFAAPDVASSVTLASGATVTVDTTGLANGTYDLIDVNSLTNRGATLPAGVSVSGNKLVLKV